mmetsp:Transcript_6846/g.11517  ORF Transcript_6846/g.11517 Transcript_6846/m.11517 type:complete len:339 (-) Transcript_6846:147-1163(-)
MAGRKATQQALLLIIGILLCPANASSASSISLPRSAAAKKHKLHRPSSFLHLKNDQLQLQQLGQFRGGALFTSKSNNNNDQEDDLLVLSTRNNNNNNNAAAIAKSVITTTSVIAIATFSFLHWDKIQAFFDREKFRTAIIQTLNDIASKGNKGLFLYAVGFMLWECCGLPTSVVETAAAMAFGFKGGLIGSFVGKTCGSLLAFTLGRTLLSNVVGEKMEENDLFGLVERGVQRHPVKSSLIVRYSPFPQLIKNFALSLTKPVTFPIFLLAISIHGFPFSLLWAALGNDSSMRLRASEMGETMAANLVLNSLLIFVTVFGFVVSPAITGWWLADLRKES